MLRPAPWTWGSARVNFDRGRGTFCHGRPNVRRDSRRSRLLGQSAATLRRWSEGNLARCTQKTARKWYRVMDQLCLVAYLLHRTVEKHFSSAVITNKHTLWPGLLALLAHFPIKYSWVLILRGHFAPAKRQMHRDIEWFKSVTYTQIRHNRSIDYRCEDRRKSWRVKNLRCDIGANR